MFLIRTYDHEVKPNTEIAWWRFCIWAAPPHSRMVGRQLTISFIRNINRIKQLQQMLAVAVCHLLMTFDRRTYVSLRGHWFFERPMDDSLLIRIPGLVLSFTHCHS